MNSGEHPERHEPQRPTTRDFAHAPVSARVPEAIGRGVLATGTLILQSGDDFAIDFIGSLAPPSQVVARVVLTIQSVSQLVAALRKNVAMFEETFGPLLPRQPLMRPDAGPPHPVNPGATAPVSAAAAGPAGAPSSAKSEGPDIHDVYDQVKLSDETASGAFANVVLIRHSAEEFCFDFIANFYPRPIVTSRVMMAAGRVPNFLDALCASLQRHRQTMPPRPSN